MRCAGLVMEFGRGECEGAHSNTRRAQFLSSRCAGRLCFSLRIGEWPLASCDVASSQPIISSVPALGGAHSIGVQSPGAHSGGFGFRCLAVAMGNQRREAPGWEIFARSFC